MDTSNIKSSTMTPESSLLNNVHSNKDINHFESYELSSDFGMKKTTSPSDKFRAKVGETSKCPSCSKPVYKMEELYGLGLSWHKSCFTCGGLSDQGCNRKLSQGEYHNRGGAPFCNPCFNRLAKEDIANTPGAFRTTTLKTTVTTTATSANSNTDDASIVPNEEDKFMPKINMAERASAFKFAENSSDRVTGQSASIKSLALADKLREANSSANKCPACTKTVYKAEELFALNSFWHPTCFTCGGTSGQGCNRRLTQQGFQNYQGSPFCNACFDKQVKAMLSSV